MRKLSELRLFFREFRRNFHDTGAVAPSSAALGRALATYVRQKNAGETVQGNGQSRYRHILEVGPGTGAVTRHILTVLEPDAHLDLVERNGVFVRALRERFKTDRHFIPAAERVRIIHDRLEELPQRPTYDTIVSGLPLNNFTAADVAAILESFAALLNPGGTLSFFEYVAVRPLRGAIGRRDERRRLREIGRLLDELFQGRRIARQCILANLPPAWVHHVRFPAPTEENR